MTTKKFFHSNSR